MFLNKYVFNCIKSGKYVLITVFLGINLLDYETIEEKTDIDPTRIIINDTDPKNIQIKKFLVLSSWAQTQCHQVTIKKI